jgi:membrane protein implicated in regulation of membrane protease activity
MHIITIAWVFVVVLMALAEATSPQGTVMGALFTLLFYGALPLSIVLYVLGTPGRRRARAAQANQANQAGQAALTSEPPSRSADPDGGGMPPGEPVAPERVEP